MSRILLALECVGCFVSFRELDLLILRPLLTFSEPQCRPRSPFAILEIENFCLEAFKLLKGTLLFLKTVYLFLRLNVYILRLYSASSSISLQIYKSTSFLSLIFSSPFPQIIAATTEYRWHGNTPRSQDLAKIRRSFMLLWRLMPDVKLAYIIPVPGICSLG